MKLAAWMMLSAFLLAQCLRAGTSASYSTTFETIGAGGGYAVSASYSLRSESGAESVAVSTSGSYSARHGFAGQLYAAVQVDFLNEDTADEGSNFQLLPSAVLDDGTRVEEASLFHFTNIEPLYHLFFSGAAEVSLGNVYEETWTELLVSFEDVSSGSYFYIRDVHPDNFGIYGEDGLPDWWQVFYFGVNQPSGLPGADPDGDSYSNLFEWHAQLDPTDRSSTFFQSFRLDGLVGKVRFGPIRAGSRYQVWWSDNLETWHPLLGGLPENVGDLRTEFDPDAVTDAPDGRRFYRIEVERN